MFKRGEIYYVHKGDVRNYGSEQDSGRPAIIVSNDVNNEHSDVVEIVFLTTQAKKDLPTHVTINPKGGATLRKSTALCEQVHSISIDRVGDYFGECTEEELDNVDKAIIVSLGLGRFVKTASAQETAKRIVVSEPSAELREEVVKLTAERNIYKELYTQLIAKMM